MNKKIVSVIMTIAMIIMSVPVLGANGDGYDYDDMPCTTSIPNKYLLGDYELGTEKEFIVQVWESGCKGVEAYREVEIVGEHQVSNFVFQDDDGEWKDYTEYNKDILIANTTHTFHVTFEEEGLYQVRATLYSRTGEVIFFGKRSIRVADGKIAITTETIPTTHAVKIDGKKVADIEKNTQYTLPNDAEYGYFSDGKMYKPGSVITVTSNVEFTSVNEMSISMTKGAGVKLSQPSGLRFKAAITSDNVNAVASETAMKSGMLLSTNDLVENSANGVLDKSSTYAKLDVENVGWYQNQIGTYCAAVVGIYEKNYTRDYVARAYVTITYTDGDTQTIYSELSDVRNISQVAKAVRADHYRGLTEGQKSIIDSFIR